MQKRQENRLQALKDKMKSNLREIKQTKAKLNMNTDIGDLDESGPKKLVDNEKEEGSVTVKELVPTLKDQVMKYSQRLERMLEDKQKQINEYKKDMKLIHQIEKAKQIRLQRQQDSEIKASQMFGSGISAFKHHHN